MRWFIGIVREYNSLRLEMFQHDTIPTYLSHGDKYVGCIGPFKTKRGCFYMAKYGLFNPHCWSVEQAEHLSSLLN